MTDVNELVNTLNVPDRIKNIQNVGDPALHEWRSDASRSLASLQKYISSIQSLPPELVAFIVTTLVPLQLDAPYTTEDIRDQAFATLQSITVTRDVLNIILTKHIKPYFVPSPHSLLDLNTGRKLPRPAGGPMAMQDYYSTQIWKTQPGLVKLLSWVVSKFQPGDYESLWPLIIPPIMTHLDDYQARYKLEGVKLVKIMLESVPSVLLVRSGVGELLYTSLTRTLTSLHDPVTPTLIRSSIPVTIELVNMLTPTNPAARFDKLCHLLGDGIIGGVWLYSSRELDAIEASVEMAGAVVKELDIGSARYLKGLIPQFIHCLIQDEVEIDGKPTSLQLTALKSLIITINVCKPRLGRWKGRILEGVGKAWVIVNDNESRFTAEQFEGLREQVKDVYESLWRNYPSVQVDYEQLLQRHPELFENVLPRARE